MPALKTPHVIIMDNASFDPKNILDELCIQDKHFFLPLPPYSPDSNPIEQAWAILKKKVTDLLREVPTIFECLERFLKLNDYISSKIILYSSKISSNQVSVHLQPQNSILS
ncbi:hypothetical protein E3V38_07425 [Streptococcus pseudopneumoniae]|nr:hypothetical protein E3V38_07425 [Streptococcus pseudopneumoniae]